MPVSPAIRTSAARSGRGGTALQELQGGLQLLLAQFHPLAAQPHQRDLEPGQLGQVIRVQRLVAEGQLVVEVHHVREAEARRDAAAAGRGDRDFAVIRRLRRRLRAQSGSRTPKPAPDSSGADSRRNRSAPAVSSRAAVGAAVRSSVSSSGNSREARPRPVSSSSWGWLMPADPQPAAPPRCRRRAGGWGRRRTAARTPPARSLPPGGAGSRCGPAGLGQASSGVAGHDQAEAGQDRAGRGLRGGTPVRQFAGERGRLRRILG